MKAILLILNVFLAVTSFSQTLSTGDKELDATLTKMNTDAKANLTSFKAELAKTYTTTTTKIDELMKKGMAISDVFMTFEIAKITKKPVDSVVKSYEANKKKGWGAIAKEMGIKPGSPEFHQLKGNSKKTGKPASSPAPAKGKPANPGKGNSKGKG